MQIFITQHHLDNPYLVAKLQKNRLEVQLFNLKSTYYMSIEYVELII